MKIRTIHTDKLKINAIAICALLIFSVNGSSFAQGFTGKNVIYLIGQVTDKNTGAPINHHNIVIMSDTAFEPQFTYVNKVVTNKNGFYYDTIYTSHVKGSLIVSTEDYLGDYHDTTVYYRFTWSDNNILFGNFELPMPPIVNNYQANFYFERNPGGQNYLQYQFVDVTNSDNILSWEWDFGDGTYSTEQNPLHLFPEPGLYRIKLTVSILSAPNSKPFITSIVKIINIVPKSYFHMGGHIFAGYFPIDKAEVFLYKVEGDEYVPIDTATFSTELGYYLFPQLIEGDYIVKADLHPTSELYNMFMTTYYSDKLHWEEADTIFHHANNYECNINLVPNNQSSYGPGKISGEVKFNTDSKKFIPAENVEIILFDDNNVPQDICHSNSNGEFILEDIAYDLYYVYAEVTGKNTYPVQVILDETNPDSVFVNLVIGNNGVNGSVNSAVSDISFNSEIGLIYPNPVFSEVNVSINSPRHTNLQISVLNSAGKTFDTFDYYANQSGNNLIVNVEHLKSGIYFLFISDGQNRQAVRKFIKK